MTRKLSLERLSINEVVPWVNDNNGWSGLTIKWSSPDIGFGEYKFLRHKDSKQWEADTETMDSDDDREFGHKLLDLWLKSMIIY